MLLAAYHLYNRCVHALVFTVCVCVVQRMLHVLHMLRSCRTEPRFIANVTIKKYNMHVISCSIYWHLCVWHVCASVWMQWVHWVVVWWLWCVVCDFSSIAFPPRICKARSTLCARAALLWWCPLTSAKHETRADFLHKYKQIYIDMI